MDRGKIQAVRKKQIREPDLQDLIQFVEKLFMSIQKILNKPQETEADEKLFC